MNMDFDDHIRIAIQNGLFTFFGVQPIDIVCGSIKYQQAMHGCNRITAILDDEMKAALFMETQSLVLNGEEVKKIQEDLDRQKKNKFANEDLIATNQRKLATAIANATANMLTQAPNLVNMLNSYCAEHVQKNMDDMNATGYGYDGYDGD